jgi:uncharacterized protein YraI
LRIFARFAFSIATALAGCAAPSVAMDSPDLAQPAEEVTPDGEPDGGAPAPDLAGGDLGSPSAITVGGMARVTAGMLNLRTGPGTMNMILTAMPCGAQVAVVGGPMNGWWNVTFMGQTGWASGNYLVAESAFDSSICGGGAMADGGLAMGGDQMAILDRAKTGVGYSYWWGHGAWADPKASAGTCVGSCPNCTHMGIYGADCSGFVAKCWQIPGPSPLTQDLHPYSTYNFYNQTTHWSKVPRGSLQPADGLVYNANGAGHIVLVESGNDPWGDLWLYEARGCATGIVHNLRTVPMEFIAIRREGL